jgi:NADPH:quinone reductase-like Zn-dependent oxidoreductase
LEALGFDKLIDYTKHDFTSLGEQYDVTLDMKADRSPFDYLRVLKTGGGYVTCGGSMLRLVQILILHRFIAAPWRKQLSIVVQKANRGLGEVSALFEGSRFRLAIDGPYPFADSVAAFKRCLSGAQKGRMVVSMRCAKLPETGSIEGEELSQWIFTN